MLLNPALAFAAQQTHILHNEKPRPSRCAEVCAVCGDFSTGYHYEVPSCNGCKTFFRRTIVSERVFKCHKNGNCLFNKDIRCACRACRFKKCLEVGMNPKAIQCNRPSASLQVVSTETKNEDNKANVAAALSASEHAIRKRAYDISSLLGINEASCSGENENMHKLPSEVTDSDSRSGYCSSNGSPRPSKVSRSGTEYDQLIETLLMYEGRAEFLRNSDFEPSISLLDTMTKPCGLDDVSKYTARSREIIHTPDYWLDMEITICLEYAKAFETYKNLSIADKCVLINETCLASALISLTYSSFLRGSSTLTFPDGSPMQLAGLGSDYFTSQLLEPLTRLRADQVSVTLLKCIIFLHGEGYGLSEEGRLAILSRRERYYDALMTHVFAVHGPQKGPGEMCDLLALSWKYFNVAARIRDNICSGNTLYRQILDTCAVWRNE